VDFQVRETFESALLFGEHALQHLGVPDAEAAAIVADTRQRDVDRFELELTGGIGAGRDLMRGNAPVPTPLVKPTRQPQALSPQTEAVAGDSG
jgi:glutathione-regulated potassium-efflux system protein KefB